MGTRIVLGGVVVATSMLFLSTRALAVDVTLGDQDFVNGQILAGSVAEFNAASAGEPVPFDRFYGSDFNPPYSQSWTFNYAPLPVSSASITLGIFDHDSQAPGNQVASFTVDGVDVTALLNTAFESSGGQHGEVNVYTVALPAAAFPVLSDGAATFQLTLTGPGLGTGGEILPGNGAGTDFATLSVVPEPAAAIAALAAMLITAATRRRAR